MESYRKVRALSLRDGRDETLSLSTPPGSQSTDTRGHCIPGQCLLQVQSKGAGSAEIMCLRW